MFTVIDPVEAESVATAALEDTTPTTIITTLYDLMDAIQTAADTDDNTAVVATVLHVLRSGCAKWHGDGVAASIGSLNFCIPNSAV
jgi:hypothetical protein